MKIRCGILSALSLLCAATGHAVPMPAVTLNEFKTPGYTLIMESQVSAPILLEKLSALDRLLPTLVDHDDAGVSLPTCVFVFPSLHWRKYLEEDESNSGFLPHRFGNFILIDGGNRGGGLRRMAFREYTLAYLRMRYPRQYPLWFEMGFSTLMSTAVLHDGNAQLGADPFRRKENEPIFSGSFWFDQSEMGTAPHVPLGQLLRLVPESIERADYHTVFAASRESWLLVHRGFVAEPEFGARFATYIANLEKMQSVDEAAEQAFTTGLDELDEQMAAYGKRKVIAVRDFPLPPPAGSSKPIPSRALKEGDALEMLARAMLDGGIETPKIARLIDGAAQVAGDTAGVRALRMRLAVRNHDDATFLKLVGDADDGHPTGLAREAGLAVVERLYGAFPSVSATSAVDVQSLRGRALALLGPVTAENPADVEAAWGYALLAADIKRDLPQAQASISAARERLPRSPDLALAAARVDEALGDHKAALRDLVIVFRFSENAELRAWVAKRIAELATQTQ